MANVPGASAVPVAKAGLQTLLRGREGDLSLFELMSLQRALSVGGPGLQAVSTQVLEAAVVRIDQLECVSPALGLLRLQLVRQIASNQAHEQASQRPDEVKWKPVEALVVRSDQAIGSTESFESGFPDTEPSDSHEGGRL